MSKSKIMYIVNAVIALVCIAGLGLVNVYGYHGFGSTIPFFLLVPWLINNIISLFRKKTSTEKFLLPFGILVVIVSIAIFVISLPAVSYPQAKDISIENGLMNLSKSPMEVTFATELQPAKSIFNTVRNAYLFTDQLDGEKVYILVSPFDGSIQVETVGDSYLDGAMELVERGTR